MQVFVLCDTDAVLLLQSLSHKEPLKLRPRRSGDGEGKVSKVEGPEKVREHRQTDRQHLAKSEGHYKG